MIWFWLAVGVFLASFVLLLVAVDSDGPWFGLGLFAAFLSSMAALFLGLSHFIPSPNDPPAPPGPHCAVQQWEQVSVGKTEEWEWVCIAWER